MNKLTLVGHIGKDAEVKDFQNGNSVINFSVAHTQKWTDKQGNKQEKSTWYDCSWFINNTNVAQYLKKGAKVLIEGEPTARAYINQQNEAVAILGVTIRSLDILVFPKDTQTTHTPQANYGQQNNAFPPAPDFGGDNPEDDLPFN